MQRRVLWLQARLRGCIDGRGIRYDEAVASVAYVR